MIGIFKRYLETVTFDHNGAFYPGWLWAISVVFLYNAIFIPLRASFVDFNLDHLPIWLPIDYACDLAYCLDMFVKARMRFYQQGVVISDANLTQRRYLRSGEFIFDLVAILPTDFAYLGCGIVYTTVRLNRVLRYTRFFELLNRIQTKTAFPNIFRVAMTAIGLGAAVFYGAIFYNSYSKAVGYGLSDADYPLSKHAAKLPFLPRFMRCLYWSCMTVLFIGEQPVPRTITDFVVEIAVWLIGIVIFGVIVGELTTVFYNINSTGDTYYRQVEGVRGYLISQKVPPDIFDKVLKWFGYAFENNATKRADKVLKELPYKLKSDIANDLLLPSLRKLQLFADLEITLLKQIAERFKPRSFIPQDYVYKKGDVGREMFVVKIGNLEVVSDNGATVFITMGPGTVFGEISLLSIPGCRAGNRRTSNVRSKGYSNLYSLSKDDLYAVLQDYPGLVMETLVEKGTEMLRLENKLDADAIAKKENEEAALVARFDKVNRTISETENSIVLLVASIKHSHTMADERLSYIESQFAIRTGAKPQSPTDDDGGEKKASAVAKSGDDGGKKVEEKAPKPVDEDRKKTPVVAKTTPPSPAIKTTKASPVPPPVKKTLKFAKKDAIIEEDATAMFETVSESSEIPDIPEIPEQATPEETSMSISPNDVAKKNSVSSGGNEEAMPHITVTSATPEYSTPTESEQSERGSSAASDLEFDLGSYFYDTNNDNKEQSPPSKEQSPP